MKSISGFTLVEMLVAFSILMLLGLNIPNIQNALEKNRQATSLRQLNSLIQLTKITAIKTKKVITLCGSTDGSTCTKVWNNAEAIIFHDQNNDKSWDSNEPLYRKARLNHSKIIWKGSNRPYMRYDPRGFLLDWGRYTFCSSNTQSTPQLILNRAGRTYKTTIDNHKLTKGVCDN